MSFDPQAFGKQITEVVREFMGAHLGPVVQRVDNDIETLQRRCASVEGDNAKLRLEVETLLEMLIEAQAQQKPALDPRGL